MRKGEIACYKQFLLFSQCFPRLMSLVLQNAALWGNGLIHPRDAFYLSRHNISVDP